MNDCVVGMLMIAVGVMIVSVCGSCRTVMLVRSKRDLLAARPRRSYAGEKHQERASDGDRAFHFRPTFELCLVVIAVARAYRRMLSGFVRLLFAGD